MNRPSPGWEVASLEYERDIAARNLRAAQNEVDFRTGVLTRAKKALEDYWKTKEAGQ